MTSRKTPESGKKVRANVNDQEVELTIEDQLSEPQTLSFWKRYFIEDFSEEDAKQPVKIEDFCDAIQQEFYSGLILPVLNESDEAIDADQLMDDLNQELRLKLSLDDQFVSLNALELFTRKENADS